MIDEIKFIEEEDEDFYFSFVIKKIQFAEINVILVIIMTQIIDCEGVTFIND